MSALALNKKMKYRPGCMENFVTEPTAHDSECGMDPMDSTTGYMDCLRTNQSLPEHVFIVGLPRSPTNSGKWSAQWSFPTRLFKKSANKGKKPIRTSKINNSIHAQGLKFL